MHIYAVERHGPSQRNVRDPIAVDVGGEDVDLMAASGKSTAESVNGNDRAAVTRRRQVGRDDVENAHASLRCYAVTGAVNGPGEPADGAVSAANRSSSTAVAKTQPTKNAVISASTASEKACAETRNSTTLAGAM